MFRYFFYRLCGGVLLCMSFIVPRAEAVLSCMLDGEAVDFELAYWDDRMSQEEPVGVIQGTDVDGKFRISIMVQGHFATTTYTFSSDGASPNRVTLLDGSSGTLYESRGGTLTVNSKTDQLVGNFAITLAGQGAGNDEVVVEMSDGIFDLSGEPASTTTVPSPQCPAELLYGADSDEVHLLRMFRDTVLSGSPEGREMVRLYYRWSGPLAEVIAGDRALQDEVRRAMEALLPVAVPGAVPKR